MVWIVSQGLCLFFGNGFFFSSAGSADLFLLKLCLTGGEGEALDLGSFFPLSFSFSFFSAAGDGLADDLPKRLPKADFLDFGDTGDADNA